MLNVCSTFGAGLKFASPGCDAVIVHDPAPVIWIVVGVHAEETVHWPEAVTATDRPELDVASNPKSGLPNVLSPSVSAVIVWSRSASSVRSPHRLDWTIQPQIRSKSERENGLVAIPV